MIDREEKFAKLASANRKILSLVEEDLVTRGYLDTEELAPVIISPIIDGVDLTTWAARNYNVINMHLRKYGAILFRNFNVNQIKEFQQFIKVTSQGELLDYTYRSTPRSQVEDKIYTSTEYPQNQSIPLHNENAYSSVWPMKIWFFCIKPSEEGGETPIADSRRVYNLLEQPIRERFIEKKVMYVRNYGELDLPWEEVFQTTSKSDVENYCKSANIKFEWIEGNGLRTIQVCEAVAKHPTTNEMVWFNQAHLFHFSSLQTEVRESLLSVFGEENIPRNAYYGDGSPIENSILDEIRGVYKSEATTFKWERRDILMLDNMLTAHGRMPFTGTRSVVVGMAEPHSQHNL